MSAKSALSQGPRVAWPRPHFPLVGVLLDDAFAVVPLHWDQHERRSYPCEQTMSCFACKLGHLPRWKLFAPMLSIGLDKVVVEVTLHGMAGIIRDLTDSEGFRGLQVRFARCTSSCNARLVGAVINRWEPFKVPAPFDVRPVLDKLYGNLVKVDYWTRERLSFVMHDDLLAGFEPEKGGA